MESITGGSIGASNQYQVFTTTCRGQESWSGMDYPGMIYEVGCILLLYTDLNISTIVDTRICYLLASQSLTFLVLVRTAS